ncbi:MAG: DMT family transporter [Anaerolineales bacterium]
MGNLLLVGAAVTWALYSVLVRLNSTRTNTLSFTLTAFFGGLLVAVPAAGWELRVHQIGEVSVGFFAGIIYLGIISTAGAAYLWNKAFALLEAGTASLTFFAQPLVGAGLGALFLNEKLSWLFYIGATLILVGLFIAAREDTITR